MVPKFRGVRIKDMDCCQKKEMGRKYLETSKLDLRLWVQAIWQRYALGVSGIFLTK